MVAFEVNDDRGLAVTPVELAIDELPPPPPPIGGFPVALILRVRSESM